MFFKTIHCIYIYIYIYIYFFLFQQVPEWKGNWTEARARTVCINAIQNNQASRSCQDLPDMDFGSGIEQCIADIQVATKTSYHRNHVLIKIKLDNKFLHFFFHNCS